ncbi:MAG: CDP-alcohol phosphatidyltransferase family protein [Anaerolineae bacterium]
MRMLADIATGLRLVIAAYIVYAGLNLGPESFAGVAAVTLIGWTLDTVDGHLARAATDTGPSWLGRHDRYIDTVMVVAGFLYATLIGVVPVWVCVAYLLLSALLVLHSRSIALLTALEAPLAALIPLLAFWLAPLWGWIFLTWGIVAAILDRRRLWVRLSILWNDLQRLRGVAENGHTELPQASEPGTDRSAR